MKKHFKAMKKNLKKLYLIIKKKNRQTIQYQLNKYNLVIIKIHRVGLQKTIKIYIYTYRILNNMSHKFLP